MPSLLFLAAAFAMTPSNEAETPELRRDLIHSDTPLWGAVSGRLWPRAIQGGEDIGCASRLRFGDWRFREPGDDGDSGWYRFTNYGVFHCAMVITGPDDRDRLDRKFAYGFLVELGTAHTRRGPVELWAIQEGTRPGSDYLLLARAPAEGLIGRFEVLQRQCPSGRTRQGPRLDVWQTRYCAINDSDELLRLARRMARLPSLGTLEFVSAPQEQD